MNPATVLLILQDVALVGSLAPVALETALKIKSLLETSGSDFTVQIKTIHDGALATIDETLSSIETWKKEKGVE